MFVTPESAAASYDYHGQTYYFCNPGCKTRFVADPEKYLSEPESQPEARPVGSVPHSEDEKSAIPNPQSEIEYTCPMHPEIIQIGPGSCPICGMALEPKEITLDEAADPEYTDMKWRFWVSAALTLPVFLLAMAEMFVDLNALFPAWPHGRAAEISMRSEEDTYELQSPSNVVFR